MDTKELFEKVKKDVGHVLSQVAHKTEFIAKISKHKLDINTYRARIKSSYRKIGEYIYSNRDQFSDDEFLADCFDRITKHNEKIENCKDTIEEIKKEHKEVNNTDVDISDEVEVEVEEVKSEEETKE